ncbi:hypothetical protein BG000_010325 [Podila horticola]|nr:hypothetical protein BG000_010325 [Podila horticola]
MADIGPQPSNSQVPALRSQHFLVRQRSYSKIGPTCAGGLSPSTLHPSNGGCYFSRSKSGSIALSPTTAELERAQFHQGLLRRSSASDLCTIPQNAALPPIVDSSKARGHGWNHGEDEM